MYEASAIEVGAERVSGRFSLGLLKMLAYFADDHEEQVPKALVDGIRINMLEQ